jgi:hypothetical protein
MLSASAEWFRSTLVILLCYVRAFELNRETCSDSLSSLHMIPNVPLNCFIIIIEYYLAMLSDVFLSNLIVYEDPHIGPRRSRGPIWVEG